MPLFFNNMQQKQNSSQAHWQQQTWNIAHLSFNDWHELSENELKKTPTATLYIRRGSWKQSPVQFNCTSTLFIPYTLYSMYTCAKKVSMTLTMGLSHFFLHQVKDLQHSFVHLLNFLASHFQSHLKPKITGNEWNSQNSRNFRGSGNLFKAHSCYVTFLVWNLSLHL